jgi:hypothetical protein
MGACHASGSFDATSRYPYIEQHHVRGEFLGDLEGVGCSGAFTHNLNITDARQHRDHPVAKQWMVVNDSNAK